MGETQTQKVPGSHYSGKNPVPTISKFLENLDKEKKERDRIIAEDNENARRTQRGEDPIPHVSDSPRKGKQKLVTDPTTGGRVIIEDTKKDMYKHVKDPKVHLSK